MRVEFLRRVANTPRGTVRELPENTAVRLAGRGYVRPVETQEVQNGLGETLREDDLPVRPDPSARKADWVDHAVSRGMNREEAESLTKAELREV